MEIMGHKMLIGGYHYSHSQPKKNSEHSASLLRGIWAVTYSRQKILKKNAPVLELFTEFFGISTSGESYEIVSDVSAGPIVHHRDRICR